MDVVWHAINRELGAKRSAGLFHSLSGVTAAMHALKYGARYDALVLFDPPVYPREGHPVQYLQQSDKESLASRAARRPERYKDPIDLAKQFARRLKNWVPDAYELMARATLRHDRAHGDYILACPREYEAHVFSSGANPDLWPQMAHCPGAGETRLRRSESRRSDAAGADWPRDGRGVGTSLRSDSRNESFFANRTSRRVHSRGRDFPSRHSDSRRRFRKSTFGSFNFRRLAPFDRFDSYPVIQMALLKIRKFPDDVLKEPAAAVKNINGSVEGLIDSMVQTMYAAPGVGLAAPQVGESKRIIVLDTNHDDPGKHLLKLINPQIVEAEGKLSGKRDVSR